MSDYFRLRIDDRSELELLNQSHAEELFELIDINREHLREWLPWLDNNRYSQNTIDFIKISQGQYENNETVQFVLVHRGELCGVVDFIKLIG